jgi:Exonuclease
MINKMVICKRLSLDSRTLTRQVNQSHLQGYQSSLLLLRGGARNTADSIVQGLTNVLSEDLQSTNAHNDKDEVMAASTLQGQEVINDTSDIPIETTDSYDPNIAEEITQLRQHGKDLHDTGDWEQAAQVFADAASKVEHNPQYRTEFCTCRLHEALCRLKLNDAESCVTLCTSILDLPDLTGPVRSRAYLRRAKAYLQMDGVTREHEALQDARAAAFLGDRKAVALYGKLLRGNSNNPSVTNDNTWDAMMTSQQPLLQELFGGKNPFWNEMPSSSSSSTSNNMLMESLLKKTNYIHNSPESSSGGLSSLLGNGSSNGGGLANSLLSSLTKRLEEDSDSICAYLQRVNPTQLQQLGSFAGLSIQENHAKRLVQFCHSITPRGIRRTVIFGKRGWYGLTLMRKVYRVLNKYKHLLILWAIAAWIQSAIRRPIPLSKNAAKLMAKTTT